MSKTEIFTKIPNIQYTEEAPQIAVEEFRKTVKSRRSVRVFDGSPVPEHVMRECLELALLSPNSSNLQPWEFHWVRSPEKKAKLVKYCLSQPAAATAAELIVCVARTATWKKNAKQMLKTFEQAKTPVPASAKAYYAKLVPLVYGQGPLGVFGLLKRGGVFLRGIFTVTPREPVSPADMRLWASKTTALGCQTLMLAFRAHGFDTCPMEGQDSARVRALLGLPRDAVIVMTLGVGKRASNGIYGPRVRFDSSLFIYEQ
ncbi:MAG: nitroreductase [Bdellovibrionales bacterium GWB1_55_8]|nr:MAG: nitroreductase [Bdellovibrionales bacterium GWB1_55_8]